MNNYYPQYNDNSTIGSSMEIKHLNAQIDMEEINKKLKDLPAPQIKLCSDDIIEGNDVVEKIQCNICFEIPIKPQECLECNALFCEPCIAKHKQTTGYGNGQKCPRCKKNLSDNLRPMNRLLRVFTFDKLTFVHCCDPTKKYKKKQESEVGLSALESFKRTAKYQEILQKQKKQKTESNADQAAEGENQEAAEPIQDRPEENDQQDQENSQNKKRNSKRLRKEEEASKKSEQIDADQKEEEEDVFQKFSYDQLLNHLTKDCKALKAHKCPNHCAEKGDELMNLSDLREHLMNDCMETVILCRECLEPQTRRNFTKKHTPKKCLTHLKGKIKKQQAQIEQLRADKERAQEQNRGDSRVGYRPFR